jgi:hypothetical protein
MLAEGAEPTVYTTFVYDAVQLVARAIGTLTRSGVSPHGGSRLVDAIRTTVFDGASGKVQLDEHGDRINAAYDYHNFQADIGSTVPVGYVSDDRLVLKGYIFFDGTQVPPLDRPALPILILTWLDGVVPLIFAVAGILSLIVSCCLVFYWRNASMIRKSSPFFLYVIIAGQAITMVGVIFFVSPPSPLTCHLRVWFSLFGMSLAYGALLRFVPLSFQVSIVIRCMLTPFFVFITAKTGGFTACSTSHLSASSSCPIRS